MTIATGVELGMLLFWAVFGLGMGCLAVIGVFHIANYLWEVILSWLP